jgi:putative hydrolase of the HAD superfamily
MKPTLLFDADGVIINGKLFSQHLQDDFGITPQITKQFFTTVFNDCLEGRADLKTEIQSHLKEWGWNKDVDSFLKYWFESEQVVDEKLIELIQSFRSRGIRCFVATNQEYLRATHMREKMNFNEWFDGVYSSADLGSKKPNVEFFERLHLKIGSPEKATTWFFDDTQKNVDSAKSFGINARLYTDINSYRELVDKEGWLVK